MCDAFLKRRDLILGLLKEVPGVNCNVPEGAFYVFPDVTHYFGKSNGDEKINNATDLAMYLLNTAHVAVVTGDAFGSPASIRISYACADEIIHEAVARISEALAKLS